MMVLVPFISLGNYAYFYMISPEAKKNNQSPVYLYIFIAFALGFLYILISGNISDNMDIVLGSFAALTLLLFCYLRLKTVYLSIIFLLPYFIGLDYYQINIGLFLQVFLSVGELYINLFTLTCLFILFLGVIEIFRKGIGIAGVPLFFIISLVLFTSMVSFLNSQYRLTGVVFLVYLMAGFMAYFLGYLLLGNKRDYLRLIFILIASSFIPAIFALFQLISGNYLFEADSELGRINSTFPHSNTFGSFLYVVLTVFIIAFFAIRRNQEERENKNRVYDLASYFPFLVLIPLLVLTYSRTAWIGLVLSLLAIALVKADIRWLIAYAGTGGMSLMMIYEKTRNRILGTFDRYMYDAIYGRFEIWDMAFFEAQKKPLIGYGIGSFEEVIRTAQGKETGNVYPHNDSVRFFLEGGLAGFLGYVLYMAGAIYYSWRSYWRYPKGEDKVKLGGWNFQVDFKLLGFIPFLLFSSMVVISLVESPSMDFVYQILSWTMLGSWLGMNDKEISNKMPNNLIVVM